MQILSLAVGGEERRILRTRTKKPKFDDDYHQLAPLHSSLKVAKQVWKGRDNPQIHVQNRQYGKSSTMPAKHILELVLDTLQRRDSYEIFAEPVDPDEVEDYYEIIKEPMDFGTMRAKLHEGMYHNLEQFEHDAFLIPENAMHFNSSATMYFRQASAIHELAKKVFHVLKTDPENFVLEFSGARRRSMRKAVKNHDSKSSTRCRIDKTSGSDVPSLKGPLMQPSVSEGRIISSSMEKKRKKKMKIQTDFSKGRRRVSNTCEGGAADRRFTYLSWKTSTLRNDINDHSAGYTNCKPLMMSSEHGDNSYKDSLMSFVKKLGPVAQMVANRKLEMGNDDEIVSVATNHVHSNASGTSLAGFPFRRRMSEINDLTEGGRGNGRPKVGACGDSVGIIKVEEKTDKCIEELNKLQKEEERGLIPRNQIIIRGGSCSALKHPSANRFKDDQPQRPIILALENYQTRNMKNADAESRDKKSSAFVSRKEELIYNKDPCMPINSSFTFDIPFLQARLQQMQGFYKSTTSGDKLRNIIGGRMN
ncbi:hypothetical protein F511_04455 [Dorcoceras hygrometricum]|uniref:Bromo domain-containing protein n=1 Tax=Dorcoceras hygrometricum TaxID=472368 RepID=A0A2Z7CEZ3_9LAMI|nr:hypothetical protein F511_04455 [Dorcoceras hygrometricum]